MASSESSWPKKITVDKRIVTILSGSTYDNFPKALKELITNSYDADASEVKINIDIKKELITIEDNGIGMNESDFDFYLRIAGKTRSKTESTLSGRKRIGQFGVGFLSVFPFSKNYNIESKKRGSSEIIFATIPNYRFAALSGDKLLDVDDIPIQGGKRIDKSETTHQYTKIKLSGFTELTNAFFNEAYRINNRRESILRFPPLERLEWELSEDLPLNFKDNLYLNRHFDYKTTTPFSVFLNSKELFRNLPAKTILETHKSDFNRIGKIKFKYFIATDYKPVKPVESRYLKIRNLNVGVGKRDAFGIGLEGRTFARLAHLTGEIHILEGMNDLINVSRDDFNFSPDFESLKDFFRERLRKWGYELDELADDEKVSKETEDKKIVKNLEGLDQESLQKRIDKLERKGYKVKQSSSYSTPFKIDKAKKEVYIADFVNTPSLKSIEIDSKTYNLKLDSWKGGEFPACKVNSKSILINKSYKLFSNRKHLDVFIKIIAILTIKVEEKSITKKSYSEILSEIERTFENY